MDSSNKRGFTLVELLVTIAVAAVLISVVVPSFTGLIESSKERATRDALVASINAAKQQAQSKRINVYICPTTDGSSCSGTWGSDWLIYEDTDGSATLDASLGDLIISNNTSKTSHIASLVSQIAFSPTGHSTINTFQVCSNTDDSVVYEIELSRMGRISYAAAAGGC
ncbi:prepilin-type N-terminal cleavage/methylation domain-containing protein [Psychromonas sp. RZ22]|uniref:GspH/FimT family pseudopilin n=1 Tax=Psychromonas algarum TaxID=2555643 RepID=UPI00106764FD|nr:GspH/FimT family pseudopilin [Psychromonas sp. RZ22]TEW56786.1 prepilin-type N-terminal cleavage/methylation domain-containing protein [Psychromonas sp. RZ22]